MDIDIGIGVVVVIVVGLGADDGAAAFQEFPGLLLHAQPLLHNEVFRQQAACQAVVVDDGALALPGQILANLQHQPALQILFILQPQLPDTAAAVRAAPPVELQGLVPADVDIGGGEQLGQLVQNVL